MKILICSLNNFSLRQEAYESIVGSGPNSAILHYVTLSRQIQQGLLLIDLSLNAFNFLRIYRKNHTFLLFDVLSGDLVLVDAGGEWMGYGTDITRKCHFILFLTKEMK